jgi:hypothetical protein
MIIPTTSSSSTDHHRSCLPPKTCRLLPATYQPNKHTVVVNKGNIAKTYEGNTTLRCLVEQNITEYITAKNKKCKTSIVVRISEEVKQSTPDKIGFVKYHNNRWFECSEHGAHDIISARFRDCKPEAFKSSNKSKAAKRRNREATSTGLPKKITDMSTAASVISATEFETSTSCTEDDDDDDLLQPLSIDCPTDPTLIDVISVGCLFKSQEETYFSSYPDIERSQTNFSGEMSYLDMPFDLRDRNYVMDEDIPEGAGSTEV